MDNKTTQIILKKLESIEHTLTKTKGNSLNDFVSEFEASKLLRRGKTWFWELRQGGFPFTKLGGQVFYNRKDLAELLEKNMENL